MKFNVEWLQSMTALALDAGALAQRLTAAGLEVDTVEPAAGEFTSVVVAEITACAPHPDADKLSLCTVDPGVSEPVQVVCGAPNARPGLKAPLATVGAKLPGGVKVRQARLRGQASSGMLCSARELGLGEDADGLMELPADARLGADLADWLALNDSVITLELTPNRADCLSLRGLAREVAALYGERYDTDPIPESAPSIDDRLEIEIADFKDCPRYAGRVIRDLDPGASSPVWLQERLRRCGLRSISPLVDVTNYVLLELGQPLHAFDLDRLTGPVQVRRGRAGESLTLLNGDTVELDERLLLIAANGEPEAIAGIMGGERSAVTTATVNVFLESAWFNPQVVSGRARALGLHTDASHRFERGVDPTLQVAALERTTELLTAIAGGRPGPINVVEDAQYLPRPEPVPLRLARLNALLGTDLDAATASAILERLGMGVSGDAECWQVTPPAARLDLGIEADLIEEVARVHGYDRIPERLPQGALRLQPHPERVLPEQRVHALCADLGYREALTWSFVDPDLLAQFGLEGEALALANPLSRELALMRPALLPGLMLALRRNLHRQRTRVRLYEIGTCFEPEPGGGHREIQRLGLVACGSALPEQWGAEQRPLDFFDLKGDLETLLALGPGAAVLEHSGVPWLHPGQAARVLVDNEEVGWLGALHPALLEALDIDTPVLALEVALAAVRRRPLPSHQSRSRFPSIRRDLALVVPETLPAGELLAAVRRHAGTVLRDVVLFDVYCGEGVESGYKSLAMGLILQDESSTLTDEDADRLEAGLLAHLREKYEIERRG